MDRHRYPASRSNPRGANRFRARSLEAAALGLAASTVPQNAAATIIYDLAVSHSPNTTFSFDGTVASEIALISATGAMGELDLTLEGLDTVELAITPFVGMMTVDYLTLFGPGETVDGSLAFATEAYMVEGDVVNPYWAAGTTGYAGFTFDDGGIPLFGWMQIEFDSSGVNFTVLQWAYDDSGAPINTADSPEPSTGILLGLGLAGLAAVVRKRRRTRLSADTG